MYNVQYPVDWFSSSFSLFISLLALHIQPRFSDAICKQPSPNFYLISELLSGTILLYFSRHQYLQSDHILNANTTIPSTECIYIFRF